MFQYEVGSAVESNPAFMVVAENMKDFPGIKTGEDYLFHVKKLLQQSQLKYSFGKKVYEKNIGSKSFYVLEGKMDIMGKTVTQEYISTVTEGFCLSFILTYTTKQEKKKLYKFINGTKI